MVKAVQRPRGKLGFSESFYHLEWPSDVTSIERSLYYWQGRDSYDSKLPLSSNPYEKGTVKFQHWVLGWIKGQSIVEGI